MTKNQLCLWGRVANCFLDFNLKEAVRLVEASSRVVGISLLVAIEMQFEHRTTQH